MTDNELKKWNAEAEDKIIKALELCNDEEWLCPQCKYIGRCKQLQRDSLDLINRQKEEIERLKAEAQMADGYADALVEYTKEKAIKEFAERLKEKAKPHYFDNCCFAVSVEYIDNLVKEMVGENNV